MYLASKKLNGQPHYFIRESYQQGDVFLNRDLIDLGPDPARYIVYPGGNAFYINEVIEDRLIELGAGKNLHELEDVFWRFIQPEIRHAVCLLSYTHRARLPEEESREGHIADALS